MAEREPAAKFHPIPIHAPLDINTCIVQHVIRVWISPGARDLEWHTGL